MPARSMIILVSYQPVKTAVTMGQAIEVSIDAPSVGASA
jgi:hypothetical protein